MRRIKVDNVLENLVENFYTDLFAKHSIFSEVENDLHALKDQYVGQINADKREYIDKIKANLLDISIANPTRLEYWKTKFEEIIPHTDIGVNFWKSVVKTLKYSELRAFAILALYQKLQINSCIYCNAQLSTILDVEFYIRGKKKGQVKNRRAFFELDHYNAKSKYPFLSISFFNLLPSCSYCNKAKSFNDALFYLYSENDDLNVFEFSVDEKTIIKYWRTRDPKDLKIKMDGEEELLKNHNGLFLTQKMYEAQMHIVEELLHKRIAYNKIYKNYLVNEYDKKLFPDNAMINRLLIGNYEKPEDIHKRPLAKFTQDIAKQLELI